MSAPQRPFRILRHDGQPIIWLGANFWSRTGGPLMWRNYDATVVREELQTLHDHGLNMTRSFFYWPDFMPDPGHVDPAMVERFADFLDAHQHTGLTSVLTFLVGHMSGENWDPAWREGRDLYGDVWLVARQAWFIRTLTERFADHPAVSGWLVSNEMPIYGDPASAETVTSWAELVLQAIRAGGGNQPCSLGDGSWGAEVTGRDNGFSVRRLGELVDFVGPHVYPMGTDPVRQHLRAALMCELAAVAGRPVVLEEFGLSSDFVSPENAGHYYRQVLHTSLLAGASGWIAWNNTDYDHLYEQAPYSHHPFEMHFGITDAQGQPKPPLAELRAFGETLNLVDLTRCRRAATATAVVVSSYMENTHPFSHPHDGPFILAAIEQAHIAAREADIPPAFVRERDGIPDDYHLYLLPSAKQLTAPGWARLLELARGGATIWASYAAGDHDNQRGPWWSWTDELFGVCNRLAYGLNDPVEEVEVELRFLKPLGSIGTGETLRFVPAGNTDARAFLPVDILDGEVIAVDGSNRPAIVRKRHGDGQAVLCTYPLEYFAAARGRSNPESTWRIYRALAEEAAATAPVSVSEPRVLVDALDHEDGRRFVWLISECEQELTVRPNLPPGHTLHLLDGKPAGELVTLTAYGVAVLELRPPIQPLTAEETT